jgi:hypothetical protein
MMFVVLPRARLQFSFFGRNCFPFFGWQNPKRTAAILWLIGSAF